MEIMNKFLVGVQGDEIRVGLPARVGRMTKDDALLLAAYLVSVATPDPEKDFQPILEELRQS